MYTEVNLPRHELSCVSSSLDDLCAVLPEGSTPIVIGSLGRRLSLIADFTDKEYPHIDDCINNMDILLYPRLNERGHYDVDLILDPGCISWIELASACNTIFCRNGRVTLDPHFGDIQNGYIMHDSNRVTFFPSTKLSGQIVQVGPTSLDRNIFVPDLPTQLAYMLNIQRIRSKDISEIIFFYSAMLNYKDKYSNYPNFAVAEKLLGTYLLSPNLFKDSARCLYHNLPQNIRESIRLKKRLGMRDPSDSPVDVGFTSKGAIFV